jgi:hypothetical protein
MGIFRKVKYLFLLLMLFGLSGCSAEYNLEIKDGYIYETSSFSVLKEDLNLEDGNLTLKEQIDYTYSGLHDVDNGQEEEKTRSFELEMIDDDSNYGLFYRKTMKLGSLNESPLLLKCYDSVNISSQDNIMKFKTSNYFNCFDYYANLDKVSINITSGYVVSNHNADEVKGNVYTWEITRDNYENKNIIFGINTQKNYQDVLSSEKSNTLINIVLIILGISLFIGGIVITVKVKNSNK